MPKVDIVLALLLAYCSGETDQRVTKLYADIANLRNTYQQICQARPDASGGLSGSTAHLPSGFGGAIETAVVMAVLRRE